MILSKVQRLFQLERSIAQGIHPIRAIIKGKVFESKRLKSSIKRELEEGPFNKTKIKEAIVEKSKIIAITFIILSNKLYLPINKTKNITK